MKKLIALFLLAASAAHADLDKIQLPPGQRYLIAGSTSAVSLGSVTVSSLTSRGNVSASTFSGSGFGLTNIPAAAIAAGTLGVSVVASSVAAVTVPGTCGSSTVSCVTTFGGDGRIRSVSSATISGAYAVHVSSLSLLSTNASNSSFASGSDAGSISFTAEAGTLVRVWVSANYYNATGGGPYFVGAGFFVDGTNIMAGQTEGRVFSNDASPSGHYSASYADFIIPAPAGAHTYTVRFKTNAGTYGTAGYDTGDISTWFGVEEIH